jgi:hypothetical protein
MSQQKTQELQIKLMEKEDTCMLYTPHTAIATHASAGSAVHTPAFSYSLTIYHHMATPDSASRRRLLSPEPDINWDSLRDDLPTGPLSDVEDDAKIFKLAREVGRPGKLMTAGRDIHDIHTTLHLVSYWNELQHPTKAYVQHRLRLLRVYLAATRGWPAAIYYDTHGSEFIPSEPGFWAGYQQPRPVTAQQVRRSSSPATRRGRGARQK